MMLPKGLVISDQSAWMIILACDYIICIAFHYCDFGDLNEMMPQVLGI